MKLITATLVVTALIFGLNTNVAASQEAWHIDENNGWATSPMASNNRMHKGEFTMDAAWARQVYSEYGKGNYYITPIFVRYVGDVIYEEACEFGVGGKVLPIHVNNRWVKMQRFCMEGGDTISYYPATGTDRVTLNQEFKNSRSVLAFGLEFDATGYTSMNYNLKSMYGVKAD